MPWSERESWKASWQPPEWRPHRRRDSPFKILQSRAEGDARASQGRFSRETWDGAIADLPNYLYDEATPRVLATPRHTAYIKIAEGCDHPCTFCIIPQLRGQFRSRRFESVIAEAERLAQSGVREITLIGQDTTCYGEDFGLKDGLALLLEKLAGIEDLRWVRFLYAYPNKITGRLLDTIASHEKICSYIDVPLQHASPSVLKRMKRGAGADIFLRSIEKMRRTIPGVTLRTSFIVGFPGETEKEFEELCQFVRDSEFDWMGAFGYSDQEGAGAFSEEKKLPEREIERRRKHLMGIQRKISKRKKKAWWARNLISSSKASPTKLTCCLKAAPPCTRRKLTAKSSSTTFLKAWNRRRASSIAARSPRPTITIWSPGSCRKPHGSQAQAEVPHLQEARDQ